MEALVGVLVLHHLPSHPPDTLDDGGCRSPFPDQGSLLLAPLAPLGLESAVRVRASTTEQEKEQGGNEQHVLQKSKAVTTENEYLVF